MKARCSPMDAFHTPTLPSLAPAATTASSLDHATQQAAARVTHVSVATAAQDDVLHRRMLASDDATRTRAELGLKCARVMGAAWTGRQAKAAGECVSHMRSE